MQTISAVSINSLTGYPTSTAMNQFSELYWNGVSYTGVERSDLLISPLLSGVTGAKTQPIVSLTTTPFTIPPQFFGLHTGGTYPSATYGSQRSHDSNVMWSKLETARGVYDPVVQANLDAMVANCTANGRHFLYNVPFTPAWASSNPTSPGDGNGTGTAWAPALMSDLTNHVNYILNRYGSQIYAIEGWNEPNTPSAFKDTLANLILHQQTIWNAVQTYNSGHSTSIKIVSPSYTDDPSGTGGSTFDNFLATGGGAYCDIIGYHIYTGNNLGLRVNRDFIAGVQSVMATRGVSAKDLWITECGDSNIGLYGSNNFVTRQLLYAAAKGVKKFFWYNWPGGGIGNMGMYQVPAAWQAAINLLSGKTVQWVNASKSLELGASINGVVQFV